MMVTAAGTQDGASLKAMAMSAAASAAPSRATVSPRSSKLVAGMAVSSAGV